MSPTIKWQLSPDHAAGKALLVINPKSGSNGMGFGQTLKLVQTAFMGNPALPREIHVRVWEAPASYRAIQQEVKDYPAELIIATGGDGTVNMVASALAGSNKLLMIVPMGSGNGLARELGIPMPLNASAGIFGRYPSTSIDCGMINGHHFFCTAGLGFEAVVAKEFGKDSVRGFYGYAKTITRLYFNHRPAEYQIEHDGKIAEWKAFMLTVANARQFGNNTFVAPLADLRDGLLDLCMIEKPNLLSLLPVLTGLFMGRIHRHARYKTIASSKFTVRRHSAGPIHIDGEPIEMGTELTISVVPQALRVVTGILPSMRAHN